MRRRGRRGAVNAASYLGGNILQGSITFLLVPIYTRAMSAEQYGILSFCLAVLAALLVIVNLGLDASVTRLYYDYKNTAAELRSFLSQSFILRVIISAGLGGVVAVAGQLLWRRLAGGEIPSFPYLPLIAACAALQSVSDFLTAFYRAARRVRAFVVTKLVQTIIQAIASIVLVIHYDFGPAGPLWGYLIGVAAVTAVGGLEFIREHWSWGVRWEYIRYNLAYGIPTIPQKVGNWLNNFSNRVLMAQYLSIASIGIYHLGFTPSALLTVLMRSVNNAYVPRFYEEMKKPTPDRALLASVDSAIIFGLSVICAALVILAAETVALIAPKEYSQARFVMPLLVVSYFFQGQYGEFLKELHFHKRTGLASLNVFIPSLATIPANMFLLPRIGIMAVVWTTFLSFLASLVGVIYFSRRLGGGIEHSLSGLAAVNAAIVAIAIVLTYSVDFEPFSTVGLLCKGLLLAAFVAVAAYVLLRPHWGQLELIAAPFVRRAQAAAYHHSKV